MPVDPRRIMRDDRVSRSRTGRAVTSGYVARRPSDGGQIQPVEGGRPGGPVVMWTTANGEPLIGREKPRRGRLLTCSPGDLTTGERSTQTQTRRPPSAGCVGAASRPQVKNASPRVRGRANRRPRHRCSPRRAQPRRTDGRGKRPGPPHVYSRPDRQPVRCRGDRRRPGRQPFRRRAAHPPLPQRQARFPKHALALGTRGSASPRRRPRVPRSMSPRMPLADQ